MRLAAIACTQPAEPPWPLGACESWHMSGTNQPVTTGERISESGFDLDQVDRLLTTTRAVRRRLDFERPVSDELIFECIDLAEQAPT